jgi:hypothetical protein
MGFTRLKTPDSLHGQVTNSQHIARTLAIHARLHGDRHLEAGTSIVFTRTLSKTSSDLSPVVKFCRIVISPLSLGPTLSRKLHQYLFGRWKNGPYLSWLEDSAKSFDCFSIASRASSVMRAACWEVLPLSVFDLPRRTSLPLVSLLPRQP